MSGSGIDPAAPRTLSRRTLVAKGLQVAGGAALIPAAGLAPAVARAARLRASTAQADPGTLTYAAEAGLPGLDPARWWNGFVWDGVEAIFDSILRVPTYEGKSLTPGLAGLPHVSRGGTLYTFKLRRGVMFHHGREMTADDVKFSLERLLSPELGSEGISLYNTLPIVGLPAVLHQKAKQVKGIKAVDRYTLTIQLEHPESVLPYVLSLPFASVVPRDVVERLGNKKFNLAPVGTGPFSVGGVDLAKGLTLTRFPKYWKPGTPKIQRVEWSFGLDPHLAVLRIQNGQLDLMQSQVPIGDVQQLRSDPSLVKQLVIGPVNLTYYFTVNVKRKPLDDVRVRRAIAMAIDREKMARVLKGLVKPASGGLFSPLSPYYQPGLAPKYDPTAAKALLAQAGQANGFDLEILGQTETPFAEMVQTAQADLKAIGINAKARLVTGDVFVREAYVADPPAMTAYLWDLPFPHGSYFMDGAFTEAAVKAKCCNLSVYVNPTFERLKTAAHGTNNPAQLRSLYRSMDKLVVSDVAAIPAFYYERVEFVGKRVQGYRTPATYTVVTFFRDYSLKA
jgi:ABC-type transport system substrate-binding protein